MIDRDDGDMDHLQQQLAVLDVAFRQVGVLGEIAQDVVSNGHELEPHEVADVLLPPKQGGEPYRARWQLVEGAVDTVKTALNERAEDIFRLAKQLGMRKDREALQDDLERIDGEKAVWVVEGGANRTSVVRRQIIIEAMSAIYGDGIKNKVVYQFGSDRPIPQLTRNRESGEMEPNKEYGIAQEIAGDNLPAEDSLTESMLNFAAAIQAGYRIVAHETDIEGVTEVITLEKTHAPTLKLVQPEKQAGGLTDGFTAVSHLEDDLEGKQFVIGTNGQYRPKDELQARRWAESHGVDMTPAVALGDEPGYEVEHHGQSIRTADRAPTVYVNEMVILKRLA